MPIERPNLRAKLNEATHFRSSITRHAAQVAGRPGAGFPFRDGAVRMQGLIKVAHRRVVHGTEGRNLCEQVMRLEDAGTRAERWRVIEARFVAEERTYQIDTDGARILSALHDLKPRLDGREENLSHLRELIQYFQNLTESGYSARSVEIIVAALANIEDQSRAEKSLPHLDNVREMAFAIARRFETLCAKKQRKGLSHQEISNEVLRTLSDQIHQEVFTIMMRMGERQEGGMYASDTASVNTHHEILNILSRANNPLLYLVAREELLRQMNQDADQAIKQSREFQDEVRARHQAQGRLITHKMALQGIRLKAEETKRRSEKAELEAKISADADRADPVLKTKLARIDAWLRNVDRLKQEAAERLQKQVNEQVSNQVMKEVLEGEKDWAKGLHARRNIRIQMNADAIEKVAPWTALLSKEDATRFIELQNKCADAACPKAEQARAAAEIEEMRALAYRFIPAAEQSERDNHPEIIGREIAAGLDYWGAHLGSDAEIDKLCDLVGTDLGKVMQRKVKARDPSQVLSVLAKVKQLRERLMDLAKQGQFPGVTEAEVENQFYVSLMNQAYATVEVYGLQDSYAPMRFQMSGKGRQAAMLIALLTTGYPNSFLNGIESHFVAFLREKAQMLHQHNPERVVELLQEKLSASTFGRHIVPALSLAFARRTPRERKELTAAALNGLLVPNQRAFNARKNQAVVPANQPFPILEDFLDSIRQGGRLEDAMADLEARVGTVSPGLVQRRAGEIERLYGLNGNYLRHEFEKAAKRSGNALVGKLLSELQQDMEKTPNLFGIMLRNWVAEEWEALAVLVRNAPEGVLLEDLVAGKLVAIIGEELNRSWENCLRNTQPNSAWALARVERAKRKSNLEQHTLEKDAQRFAVLSLAESIRVGMAIAQRNCDEELQGLKAFILPPALLAQQARDFIENRHKEIRHIVDIERDGMQILGFKLHRIIHTVTDHFDFQAAVGSRIRKIQRDMRKRQALERGDFHDHPLEHSDPSPTDRDGAYSTTIAGETPEKGKKPTGAYYGIFSFGADLADPYSQVNLYMDFGPGYDIERVPLWFIASDAGRQVGEDFVYRVKRGVKPRRVNRHEDLLEGFRAMIDAQREPIEPSLAAHARAKRA